MRVCVSLSRYDNVYVMLTETFIVEGKGIDGIECSSLIANTLRKRKNLSYIKILNRCMPNRWVMIIFWWVMQYFVGACLKTKLMAF